MNKKKPENTDRLLDTKYRPKEQEVRSCLKWLFESKYIQFGEECWMDKDKEDYEKGSSEENIADIVFTDSGLHDLTALELKGDYFPSSKAIQQLKTYRKFVDNTYLVCSSDRLNESFVNQCKEMGVGIVNISIDFDMILDSTHPPIMKMTRNHLIKLRKSFFFDLLRKFNIVIKDSERYWENFEKYCPILLKKHNTGELLEAWKELWTRQNFWKEDGGLLTKRYNKKLVFSGEQVTSWFVDNGQFILDVFGKIYEYSSYDDYYKELINLKGDIEEILSRSKPMEPTIKREDDRF